MGGRGFPEAESAAAWQFESKESLPKLLDSIRYARRKSMYSNFVSPYTDPGISGNCIPSYQAAL
jgi:hypothetical protein